MNRSSSSPTYSHGRSSMPATLTSPVSHGTRFEPVRLTGERIDQMHEDAKELLMRTIDGYMKLDGKRVDTKRWRYMRSRSGLTVFRDRRPLSPRLAPLLAAGTLPARFDDVMEGLYMDTSEDTRILQNMFNYRLVDAELLHPIERRTQDRPFGFTGLKWSLLKVPGGGVISNRDMCFYEKLGTINLPDNRKLGYFMMRSVELPECPPSLSRMVVRAQISLCYIMEELEDNLVGIYANGTLQGNGPQFLANISARGFADVVLSVDRTPEIARAKRYARLMSSVPSFHRIPRSKSCEVCNCSPSFFDSHEKCFGCSNRNVCKSCRVKCSVFRHEHNSTRLVRADFCIDCVKQVEAGAVKVMLPRKRLSGDEHARGSSTSCNVHAEGEPQSAFASSFATVSSDDEYAASQAIIGQGLGASYARTGSSSNASVSSSASSFTQKVAMQLRDMGYYSKASADSRISGLTSLGTYEKSSRLGDIADDDDDDSVVSPVSIDDEGLIELASMRQHRHQPPQQTRERRHHSHDVQSPVAVLQEEFDSTHLPSHHRKQQYEQQQHEQQQYYEHQELVAYERQQRGYSLQEPSTGSSGSSSAFAGAPVDRAQHQRALMHRLLQVSYQAEQTFHLAKQQTKVAQTFRERYDAPSP